MLKRIVTSFLSVLLAFSLLIIPTADEANADWTVKELKYSQNVTVYKFSSSDDSLYGINLGKRANGAKKVTLASSKKGVLKDLEGDSEYARFTANKEGKTVLTIKVKKKNGTTKKYKVNVTVKKFTSPMKSFKIGKTSYTKKVGTKTYMTIKVSKKSAKLKIVPKKGWKVGTIYYSAMYDGDNENLRDIDKEYKNNAVVKFQKNKDYEESLRFTMTEKATGFKIQYQFDIAN